MITSSHAVLVAAMIAAIFASAASPVTSEKPRATTCHESPRPNEIFEWPQGSGSKGPSLAGANSQGNSYEPVANDKPGGHVDHNRARVVRYLDPVSHSVTAGITRALYDRLEVVCKQRRVLKAAFLRDVLEAAVREAETTTHTSA